VVLTLRFEVEGAGLARTFATGWRRQASRAIDLGQRRPEFDALDRTLPGSRGCLCTAGICLDVIGLQYGLIPSDEMKKIVDGDAIRVPPALIQPAAPDDVAEALAEIAVAPPLNGMIELAGPETICLNELARLILSAHEDPRPVIADARARFFGAMLDRQSLVPGPNPRIGPSTVRDWLRPTYLDKSRGRATLRRR